MRWVKLGRIFEPRTNVWWMRSFAMVPTALWLREDLYRIFFSGRDEDNRSHIGFFDVDLKKPFEIFEVSKEPVLSPGELGCFDDSGVTPSWALRHQDKIYLYYIGWNKRSSVRMGLITGLAVSHDDGKTFQRFSRAPILERTDKEPFSILTGACVMKDQNLWKMWYVSGIGWENADLPKYNIKYARSKDGIKWKREGLVCIDLLPHEHALARPCVLKEDGIYKMWFSCKGKNYRMGYGESQDGLSWIRKDTLAGIDVSPSGWDAEMMEYTCIVNHKGKRYMFYNGNNYGAQGIGLAVSEGNEP